jgi:hypothetical protein
MPTPTGTVIRGILLEVEGPRGRDGKDGTPGQDGQAATIDSIVAHTLEPDEPATAENNGTPEHADIDFGIPRGKDGKAGPAGAPGKDGKDGADGKDGKDGNSYAIKGSVPTYADLPTTGNVQGDGWVVDADGLLYVYGPMGFPDSGKGVHFVGEKGDKGDPGADGKDGAPGADGKDGADGKSFNNKGAWESVTTYEPLDYVSHNGASYVARAENTGVEPPNATYWTLNSAKGEDGASGKDGKDGKDGAGIDEVATAYQLADSGATIPTGNWSTTIPTIEQGKWLWKRTTTTYTDERESTVAYEPTYQGKDAGTESINGVVDQHGNHWNNDELKHSIAPDATADALVDNPLFAGAFDSGSFPAAASGDSERFLFSPSMNPTQVYREYDATVADTTLAAEQALSSPHALTEIKLTPLLDTLQAMVDATTSTTADGYLLLTQYFGDGVAHLRVVVVGEVYGGSPIVSLSVQFRGSPSSVWSFDARGAGNLRNTLPADTVVDGCAVWDKEDETLELIGNYLQTKASTYREVRSGGTVPLATTVLDNLALRYDPAPTWNLVSGATPETAPYTSKLYVPGHSGLLSVADKAKLDGLPGIINMLASDFNSGSFARELGKLYFLWNAGTPGNWSGGLYGICAANDTSPSGSVIYLYQST